MADYALGPTRTATAAADLRTLQYHILRMTAAGTVNTASHAAATAVNGPIGVLQNKPNSGQSATIAYGTGETKVKAAGSITVNVLVTTNGSGQATAAVSGDIVIGRALQAAGAGNEVIRMELMQPFPLLRT